MGLLVDVREFDFELIPRVLELREFFAEIVGFLLDCFLKCVSETDIDGSVDVVSEPLVGD